MIVRKVSIGLLIMVLVACARTKDSKTQTSDLNTSHLQLQDTARIGINQLYLLESYLYDQPLDTAQVIEVDFDCAILVFPSDEQIKQMKIEYGEQDFYIIADDNNWYQGTSIGLLDSANVMKSNPDNNNNLVFTYLFFNWESEIGIQKSENRSLNSENSFSSSEFRLLISEFLFYLLPNSDFQLPNSLFAYSYFKPVLKTTVRI